MLSSAISSNDRAKSVKGPRVASLPGAFGAPVRYENVAEAPDGLDMRRMRGIFLDDLPQARDLHVDGAVEHLVFAAARQLHQLVARERRARMLDEHLEDRELARGELHRLASL